MKTLQLSEFGAPTDIVELAEVDPADPGAGTSDPGMAHQFVDNEGLVWVTEDDFVNHFAGDVDPVTAKVLYAVQQPLSGSALNEVMTVPAWKSLPSWYLVAQDDQASRLTPSECSPTA
jgi:hypothetical protein